MARSGPRRHPGQSQGRREERRRTVPRVRGARSLQAWPPAGRRGVRSTACERQHLLRRRAGPHLQGCRRDRGPRGGGDWASVPEARATGPPITSRYAETLSPLSRQLVDEARAVWDTWACSSSWVRRGCRSLWTGVARSLWSCPGGRSVPKHPGPAFDGLRLVCHPGGRQPLMRSMGAWLTQEASGAARPLNPHPSPAAS